MGILDDAIKEHLELKRQHGAGESELKQLEDEAFGAAERPGPTAEEREAIAEQPTEMYDVEEELAPPQAEGPSEEELVEEEMDEPRLAPVDPLAGLEEEIGEEEPAQAEEEQEAEEEQVEPEEEYEEDDDFWDEKRLSDELDQALEGPSEAEDDTATELYEDAAAEDDLVEEDEGESSSPHTEEDVLEETPDFLEEAPEDDQLWFEQKPPKDFDFDD
jgi:hypothetical protein